MPTNNTFADTLRLFIKEKFKDIAKVFNYAIAWTSIAKPDLSPDIIRFGGAMKDFKNFVGATEAPGKTESAFKAIQVFAREPKWNNFRKVISETSLTMNSYFDATELANKFFPISKEVFQKIQNVNFIATTVGSLNGAAEEIEKLSAACDKGATDLARLRVINLARNVSYLALGLMGLYSAYYGITSLSLFMLASVCSGLLFGIGGYFYERIVDPEMKHQNKDKIIQNLTIENLNLRRA